jgi:hypothetical protein
MYYTIAGTNVRLLGSMHLVPADRAELPSFVERGYTWCKRLAFEGDTNSLDMRWLMNLPDGWTLDQKIPAPLLKRMQVVWPPNHPFGVLRNQNLWLIAMRIPLLNVALTPGLVHGVETLLTQRAMNDKKPIDFLETPADFNRLANSFDDGQYFEIFGRMLDELPRFEQRFREMHDAWSAGDPHRFEKVLQSWWLVLLPTVRKVLLDHRNAAWLPQILNWVREPQPTLVAVGAAHLFGEKGLIKLLEQQGHTALQIP